MKTMNIDFLKIRRVALTVSVFLVIASIVLLTTRFLNLGLDFTGGVQVELGFDQPANLNQIRQKLQGTEFESGVVQHFGQSEEVLFRISLEDISEASANNSNELSDRLLHVVQEIDSSVEIKQSDFVGPQVGEELRDQSGIALLSALVLMLIYITLRFQFKFAVGAVAALFHDVVIVLGFFSLTGLTFDLSVLAALLAVIGYSLNDTIVVSDRIRENFHNVRSDNTLEIINTSLNQTIGRTLITSLTTLLVLVALALYGGETLKGFALALIAGVLVGTYSSIYIASSLLIEQKLSRDDFLQPENDEEETDFI